MGGGASQPNTTELVPEAANSTGLEMPSALLASTGAEGAALGEAVATVSPEGAELEAVAQSGGVGGCRKYSGRNCYGSGSTVAIRVHPTHIRTGQLLSGIAPTSVMEIGVAAPLCTCPPRVSAIFATTST